MTENTNELQPLEPLNQILNPGRWEDVFLIIAIKRCQLLWANIGIPSNFKENPTSISEWVIEVLQKENIFSESFSGPKQEFVSKWATFWTTAHRDFFSNVTHQYGLEHARKLYRWCYWQGGVGFPLLCKENQRRYSTWSILDAWGCVIIEMVYHYNAQAQSSLEACPPLPPELLEWIEVVADLQSLKELPKNVPEFQEGRSVEDNAPAYSLPMLPARTLNLIRETMLHYYHPDPCIDDDRVDEILANMKTVPLDPRELELLKYIGTEYSSDEESAPPKYVEKYIDIELTLKTFFRYHRYYAVMLDLENLLNESEKKALIEWARKAVVYPPYGNAEALIWPSEVDLPFFGEDKGE